MDAAVRSSILMGLIFALSQLGAIFVASSFLGPEDQLFPDPDDPMIPILYILAILAFTFAILYIIKKKRENLVRIIFLGAVAYTIFFVIWIVLMSIAAFYIALVVSTALTAVLTYYLVKWPEWYVIDAAGILMSIGIIGIFGISLSILPTLVLLIALAVYDAISVYGTKHMIALADGVTSMKLPILLVIPRKRGYSYLEQKSLRKQLEEGGEREAMFMGLGDVIIPGVLVVSAFSFLNDEVVGGISSNLIVALGTVVGALVGYALLMRFVLKGNAQAGLPLLNGGAIAGFLITYLLVYQDLSFGIAL